MNVCKVSMSFIASFHRTVYPSPATQSVSSTHHTSSRTRYRLLFELRNPQSAVHTFTADTSIIHEITEMPAVCRRRHRSTAVLNGGALFLHHLTDIGRRESKIKLRVSQQWRKTVFLLLLVASKLPDCYNGLPYCEMFKLVLQSRHLSSSLPLHQSPRAAGRVFIREALKVKVQGFAPRCACPHLHHRA